MKKGRQHIKQVLSIVLLWVFAIALTPFGALHHHAPDPQCSAKEKNCTHKLHVSTHADTCLICAAHFEKNYLTTKAHFEAYLETTPVVKHYAVVNGTYTELISLALRGPPAV